MDERDDMQAKLGTTDRRHMILIIGISRGIGRGLAAEYLRRGWFVIGTVRSSAVAPELTKDRIPNLRACKVPESCCSNSRDARRRSGSLGPRATRECSSPKVQRP